MPGGMLKKFLQQGRRRVETAGGTNRTSCGPFAPTMDLGERIGSSRASCLRETFCYVEDFDEPKNEAWEEARLGAPGLGG